MAGISVGETLFPQACNCSVFRGVRDLPFEARAAYISKFVPTSQLPIPHTEKSAPSSAECLDRAVSILQALKGDKQVHH